MLGMNADFQVLQKMIVQELCLKYVNTILQDFIITILFHNYAWKDQEELQWNSHAII